MDRPLLVLQGLEDEVVPPDQAERMVRGMQVRKLPYAYLAFEGEQHGFRKAESIQRSLEAELAFYAAILRIELPEPAPELQIHNR
jgi:dipeptidyl aminopeptidase/acylaminoacyl peptidase